MLVQETSVFDIRNCDCMTMMKEYPDKHFELAIVDPPYGIGFDGEYSTMTVGIRKDGTQRFDKTWKNKRKELQYIKKEWDKNKPNKSYFTELFRVSDKQIIWGGNYFTDILPVTGGWVVWDKGVSENMSLSQCELAYTNCLNSIKIFKVLWSGYKKENQEKRIHPTQKPVALYEWLLTKYAKKGDKILDTHMGSGSIAIACHNLGFDLTASELDKDYYEAALERINFHTAQKRLF